MEYRQIPPITLSEKVSSLAPQLIVLCLILLIATYLRMTNLPNNPAWYTDEGTHLSIVHHLLRGEIRYFAVTDSMLLFARPPLFHACLALVSHFFGEGIATLRGFTAILGILSVGLLFILIKSLTHNPFFALWGAFLYAIYPQAVLYSRFGFSYALLTPIIVLLCLFLTRFIQTGRWNFLALAGILAGIGLLGDIMMGAVIVIVALITFFKSPKMLLWLIPLMGLPFGVYGGIMLIGHPDAFLFDLNFTLNRLGGISIAQQLNTISENFTMLLSTDLWFPLGVVGIFLIKPPALRVASACLVLLTIVIIGRTVALFHLSFYYMSPLFPIMILGVATLTWRGGDYLMTSFMPMFANLRFITQMPVWIHRLMAGMCMMALIGAPLWYSTQYTINGINSHIPTAIDPFLVDGTDGEAVIAFFETIATENTLILASPSIGWALELYTSAQVADWQMHIAYIGYDAIHLPYNLPHERYAFIPTSDRADYVVIDNIWRNWGNFHVPEALVLYNTILAEWELIFEAGTLAVYGRPR
ncbi:MAG: glycosyltransferase family 39 protein [Phototrophicales bacterium]|nr:glycosyltransferase family 39 protein [Phototrophicales bacterium]